jgi:hypothetical protein
VTDYRAIETNYAGCLFRSRLEARWAVFFDHLEIPWEYEAQGYDLGSRRYLPDFRIEAYGKGRLPVLVEVKGEEARVDMKLIEETVRATELPVLILGPVPRPALAPYVHRIMMPMGDCSNCERPSDPSFQSAIFRGNGLYTWGVSAIFGGRYPFTQNHNDVEAAYRAARSARFEHGESGAPNTRMKALGRILEGD